MAWVYSLHSLDRSSCFWEGKRAEIYRHRPHCSIWPQRQSLFLGLLHLLALLLKKKDTLSWRRLDQCKSLPVSFVPVLCDSNINYVNRPGIDTPSKHIPGVVLGGNTWVTFALWGRNYWHMNCKSAWKVPSRESFPNDVMGAGILYRHCLSLSRNPKGWTSL